MTVKTTVTLSEDLLRYAEKLVEDGHYPSISSVIEAGIAQMIENETPAVGPTTADPLDGMGDEIRRRLELPRDQWIPLDNDTMFEEIEAMVQKLSKAN
ncbi:hypothetical protein HGO38_29765 [Rhizobium sp. CG5]|uniref:ribbon-helix-helix domain-containing protein n=1 Tax=Rhizobium sp. CG5 TaxID=2726076 RepID=UPI00203435F8|nr:hypothetical protein [Rhizobium sp. CG5]MCM2477639.1 hypothetical protein [Rhizobium sp. CG5]